MPSYLQDKYTLHKHTTVATPPPNKQTILVNADTGTTGHYIAIKDMHCLDNITPVAPNKHINIIMPNGKTIQSSYTGELPLLPSNPTTKSMCLNHSGDPS